MQQCGWSERPVGCGVKSKNSQHSTVIGQFFLISRPGCFHEIKKIKIINPGSQQHNFLTGGIQFPSLSYCCFPFLQLFFFVSFFFSVRLDRGLVNHSLTSRYVSCHLSLSRFSIYRFVLYVTVAQLPCCSRQLIYPFASSACSLLLPLLHHSPTGIMSSTTFCSGC